MKHLGDHAKRPTIPSTVLTGTGPVSCLTGHSCNSTTYIPYIVQCRCVQAALDIEIGIGALIRQALVWLQPRWAQAWIRVMRCRQAGHYDRISNSKMPFLCIDSVRITTNRACIVQAVHGVQLIDGWKRGYRVAVDGTVFEAKMGSKYLRCHSVIAVFAN